MEKVSYYYILGGDVGAPLRKRNLKQVYKILRKCGGRVFVYRVVLTKGKQSTSAVFRRCKEYPLNLIHFKEGALL